MYAETLTQPLRLIMYHKSPTSGRTQFLCQPQGVCVIDALPRLAQVLDAGDVPGEDKVLLHPSPLLQRAAQWLSISSAELEMDPEFCERVDVAGGPLTVYLARFKTIDPPLAAAQHVGGRFIALTEGRHLAPAELELLRRAYRVIMEG